MLCMPRLQYGTYVCLPSNHRNPSLCLCTLRVRRAVACAAVLLGDEGRGWHTGPVPTQEVCGGAAAAGDGETGTHE